MKIIITDKNVAAHILSMEDVPTKGLPGHVPWSDDKELLPLDVSFRGTLKTSDVEAITQFSKTLIQNVLGQMAESDDESDDQKYPEPVDVVLDYIQLCAANGLHQSQVVADLLKMVQDVYGPFPKAPNSSPDNIIAAGIIALRSMGRSRGDVEIVLNQVLNSVSFENAEDDDCEHLEKLTVYGDDGQPVTTCKSCRAKL